MRIFKTKSKAYWCVRQILGENIFSTNYKELLQQEQIKENRNNWRKCRNIVKNQERFHNQKRSYSGWK